MSVVAKPSIPHYPIFIEGAQGPVQLVVRRATGVGNRAVQEEFLVPHRKDYYLLVLVREGDSKHWIDGIPYTLQADTFYFTIPQQVHLKEEAKPLVGMSACFTEEWLQLAENSDLKQLPIITNPANGHELKLNAAAVQFIEQTMQQMLAEYNSNNDWRSPMLSSWMRILLVYVSRLYAQQYSVTPIDRERPLLQKFQLLIDRHYATQHDVAAYAAQLHITAGHLNEQVKKQSGQTALWHIHDRLRVEAKRRLLHTGLSIKEIADELGFEDDAYFNRFFKRLVGNTPADYRRSAREMYR